jgi:glycerol-3-phosphate responsive antiterminator
VVGQAPQVGTPLQKTKDCPLVPGGIISHSEPFQYAIAPGAPEVGKATEPLADPEAARRPVPEPEATDPAEAA